MLGGPERLRVEELLVAGGLVLQQRVRQQAVVHRHRPQLAAQPAEPVLQRVGFSRIVVSETETQRAGGVTIEQVLYDVVRFFLALPPANG